MVLTLILTNVALLVFGIIVFVFHVNMENATTSKEEGIYKGLLIAVAILLVASWFTNAITTRQLFFNYDIQEKAEVQE